MTHQQLAGAFDCSSGHVDTVKEQHERVQRTMARWRTTGVKKVFDCWLDFVDIPMVERGEEATELAKQEILVQRDELETAQTQDMSQVQLKLREEVQRRVDQCKRVVRRILQHQLMLAWGTFVNSIVTVKTNRETVRKVLARMTRQQLAGAFDCYSGHVNTVKEQHERVQRTMARWRTPGIQKAFNCWLSYIDITLSEHAEAARELGKQELLEAAQKGQSKAESEVKRRIEMCKHVVYVAPAVVQVLVCTC